MIRTPRPGPPQRRHRPRTVEELLELLSELVATRDALKRRVKADTSLAKRRSASRDERTLAAARVRDSQVELDRVEAGLSAMLDAAPLRKLDSIACAADDALLVAAVAVLRDFLEGVKARYREARELQAAVATGTFTAPGMAEAAEVCLELHDRSDNEKPRVPASDTSGALGRERLRRRMVEGLTRFGRDRLLRALRARDAVAALFGESGGPSGPLATATIIVAGISGAGEPTVRKAWASAERRQGKGRSR